MKANSNIVVDVSLLLRSKDFEKEVYKVTNTQGKVLKGQLEELTSSVAKTLGVEQTAKFKKVVKDLALGLDSLVGKDKNAKDAFVKNYANEQKLKQFNKTLRDTNKNLEASYTKLSAQAEASASKFSKAFQKALPQDLTKKGFGSFSSDFLKSIENNLHVQKLLGKQTHADNQQELRETAKKEQWTKKMLDTAMQLEKVRHDKAMFAIAQELSAKKKAIREIESAYKFMDPKKKGSSSSGVVNPINRANAKYMEGPSRSDMISMMRKYERKLQAQQASVVKAAQKAERDAIKYDRLGPSRSDLVSMKRNYDKAIKAELTEVKRQQKAVEKALREAEKAKTRTSAEEAKARLGRKNAYLNSLQSASFLTGSQLGVFASFALRGGPILAGFAAGLAVVMVSFKGLEAAITNAVKAGSEFEASVSNFLAVVNPSAEALSALQSQAEGYGRTTIFTAEQSMNAMTELAKLGYSTAEVMKMSQATLSLAAVSGASFADSALAVGRTLAQMRLNADQATNVVNIMTAAFNASALDFSTFTETMKYVGPIAGQMKVELSDLTAVMGTLANAGIDGSTAGTALRSMLLKLSDPTSKLTKKLKDLGYTFKGDITEALNVLATKGGGITPALAKQYVGQYAATAMTAATDNMVRVSVQGSEKVKNKFLKDFGQYGKVVGDSIEMTENYFQKLSQKNAFSGFGAGVQNAEQAMKKMIDNLQGDLKKLGATWASFGVSLFSGFGDNVRHVIQYATTMIDAGIEWAKQNEGFIQRLGKGAEAIGKSVIDLAAAVVKLAESLPGVKGMINEANRLAGASGSTKLSNHSEIGNLTQRIDLIFTDVDQRLSDNTTILKEQLRLAKEKQGTKNVREINKYKQIIGVLDRYGNTSRIQAATLAANAELRPDIRNIAGSRASGLSLDDAVKALLRSSDEMSTLNAVLDRFHLSPAEMEKRFGDGTGQLSSRFAKSQAEWKAMEASYKSAEIVAKEAKSTLLKSLSTDLSIEYFKLDDEWATYDKKWKTTQKLTTEELTRQKYLWENMNHFKQLAKERGITLERSASMATDKFSIGNETPTPPGGKDGKGFHAPSYKPPVDMTKPDVKKWFESISLEMEDKAKDMWKSSSKVLTEAEEFTQNYLSILQDFNLALNKGAASAASNMTEDLFKVVQDITKSKLKSKVYDIKDKDFLSRIGLSADALKETKSKDSKGKVKKLLSLNLDTYNALNELSKGSFSSMKGSPIYSALSKLTKPLKDPTSLADIDKNIDAVKEWYKVINPKDIATRVQMDVSLMQLRIDQEKILNAKVEENAKAISYFSSELSLFVDKLQKDAKDISNASINDYRSKRTSSLTDMAFDYYAKSQGHSGAQGFGMHGYKGSILTLGVQERDRQIASAQKEYEDKHKAASDSYDARVGGLENALVTAKILGQADQIKKAQEALDEARTNGLNKYREYEASIIEEMKNKQIEAQKAVWEATLSYASTALDQITNIFGEYSKFVEEKQRIATEKENARYDRQTKGIQTVADARMVSERTASLMQYRNDKKHEERLHQIAMMTRNIKRMEIIGGMASAIMNAWAGAMPLGPIVGPILAGTMTGLITATSIQQLSALNAQKFAKGGAFTNQVVNKPTNFAMGQMGEAGPEAIMPLRKMNDGSLGVMAITSQENKGGQVVYAPSHTFNGGSSEADIRRVLEEDRQWFENYTRTSRKKGYAV